MPNTYSTDPYVIELCARLRAAREAVPVNGVTAARAMGMNPARVSALETGSTEPRAKDVKLYAQLTGATLDDLVYGDDPAAREPIEVPDTEDARRVAQGGAGRARSLQKRREARPRPIPANRAPSATSPTWRPAAWRKQEGEAS